MSHFRRILSFALPFWKNLLAISLVILAVAGFKQVEPFVFKQITDRITDPARDPQVVLPQVIVIFLAIYLLVKALMVILNRLSWYLTSLF